MRWFGSKSSSRALPSLLLFLALPASVAGQAPPPFQLQVDLSPLGMVSAAQPLATWAGAQILEAGGNAADAAVAAAFAIAVVEPTMNSIGGRTQILVRLSGGEVVGIDATTQAPLSYDPSTAAQADSGYAVIGVPGAVAGLARLLEEHGSFPLPRVMEPAIRFAEEGFHLDSRLAGQLNSAAEVSAEFEGTREYYLKGDGTPWEAGDVLRQPVLGASLRKIAAQGPDVFYRGELARAMVDDIQANGGVVTLESLRDYRAEDALVVRGSYRGYELVGSYIPSAGALAIEALQILEHFDLGALGPPERVAVVGQALGLAFEDWGLQGPPEMAERLTSRSWAAERAREIRWSGSASGEGPETGPDGRFHLPGYDPSDHLLGSHTTHLSTADAEGMMVSLTQTLGPNMGSHVATPGLGFLYASTLGGYLGSMEPGERARSNICPFMVLKDGEPVLVLGGAGGSMIPVAVVNAIVHFIDEGLPFPEAVAAPRVTWDRRRGLVLETHEGAGFTRELADAVRALGFQVTETAREAAFGRIHGIRYHGPVLGWEGVADPDWGGSALGPATRVEGGG